MAWEGDGVGIFGMQWNNVCNVPLKYPSDWTRDKSTLDKAFLLFTCLRNQAVERLELEITSMKSTTKMNYIKI